MMATLHASSEALENLNASLGRTMREGTNTIEDLSRMFEDSSEDVENHVYEARSLRDRVEQRLQDCRTQLSRCQRNLEVALNRLEQAEQDVRSAQIALAACLSQPASEDHGPPDCSSNYSGVQEADNRLAATQIEVDRCRSSVDLARQGLDDALQISNEMSHVFQDIRACDHEFSGLLEMYKKEAYRISNVLNYSIPRARGELGYKISVLRSNYLVETYGGLSNIPSLHGTDYRKARTEFLTDAVYDHRIKKDFRRQIQQDIGEPGRYYIRSPNGTDVGHRFRGVDHVANLRLEERGMNRARGGRHGR